MSIKKGKSMNINNISTSYTPAVNFSGNYNQARYNRINNTDTFVPSKNRTEHNNHKHKKNTCKVPKRIAALLTSFAMGAGAHAIATRDTIPSPVVIPYNAAETEIAKVADIYNTSEDAILAINNIENEDELYDVEKIAIPAVYDKLDKKIENVQEKLYNSKLTAEERDELVNQYKELSHKKLVRENIAETYTDGKYMYYIVKPLTSDTTYDAAKLYSQFGDMNVEVFKEVFGIKDKAIRKYNVINYEYRKDTPEYSGAYKDYSNASLKAGQVIKVPLSALKD